MSFLPVWGGRTDSPQRTRVSRVVGALTPTAPPAAVPRPKVIVSQNAGHRSLQARTRFARHPALVTRARSTPTATPLVRNRVIEDQTAERRSRTVRAFFARHQATIAHPAYRAVPRAKIVQGDGARRSLQLRTFFGRRGLATVVRARLAPAAVYVRPKVFIISRARPLRARASVVLILKAPSVPTLVYVRPKIIEDQSAERRSRLVRAYFARHAPIVLRAPAAPAVVVPPYFRPKVVVGPSGSRASIERAYFARHQPLVVRPPTPAFYRKKIIVTSNGDRVSLLARTRFARHPVRITAGLQAPNPARATPLRILVSDSGRRASLVRAYFQHHEQARVERNPVVVPFVYVRPKILATSNGDARALQVRSRFLRHRPRLLRAPSTPTATPLVAPHVIIGDAGRRAARIRAFVHHHEQARVTRNPIAVTAPTFVRPKVIVSKDATRVVRLRAYFARHPATLAHPSYRAVPRPKIVQNDGARRSLQIRAFFGRRNAAQIVRPAARPAPAFTRPKVIVTHGQRRALTLAAFARHREHPRITRARSVTTPTPLVRNRVVLGKSGDRAALVRCYFGRRNLPLFAHPSYVIPGAILTGAFDPTVPRGQPGDGPRFGRLGDGWGSQTEDDPNLVTTGSGGRGGQT